MGAKFAVIYSETSVLQYVDNMIVRVFNDIESAKDFICEHMLNPETSYIEFDGLVWVANDAENNKLIQYQIVRLEDFVTDDESTTVPVPCTDEESKAPTVDGLSEQLTPAPIHLFDNIGHAFKSSHKFIEDNLEAVIPAYCYYMGKTTDNTDMLILDVNDDYDYFKLGKLNFVFRRLRALAEEWRYICYYPNRGEDNEDHFDLHTIETLSVLIEKVLPSLINAVISEPCTEEYYQLYNVLIGQTE